MLLKVFLIFPFLTATLTLAQFPDEDFSPLTVQAERRSALAQLHEWQDLANEARNSAWIFCPRSKDKDPHALDFLLDESWGFLDADQGAHLTDPSPFYFENLRKSRSLSGLVPDQTMELNELLSDASSLSGNADRLRFAIRARKLLADIERSRFEKEAAAREALAENGVSSPANWCAWNGIRQIEFRSLAQHEAVVLGLYDRLVAALGAR